MKHVVVLEDAACDIEAAIRFYESIKAGLGDYLLDYA
jgi:hypothetical protein